MIGKITSEPFVETVKNGEAKALFAEVELAHDEVRTVQLFPGAGAETWPCKGDKVVVERSGALLYAAAIWDGAEPALKPGEREIYSRDAGGKKLARHLLTDKHYIGNQLTDLCTVLLGILDIIKNLKTFGSPSLHNVLPAYIPDIEAQKEEVKKILKDGA